MITTDLGYPELGLLTVKIVMVWIAPESINSWEEFVEECAFMSLKLRERMVVHFDMNVSEAQPVCC